MSRNCTRDRNTLAWIAVMLSVSVSCAVVEHEKPKQPTTKALPAIVLPKQGTTRGSDDNKPRPANPTSVIDLINSTIEKNGAGREENLIIVTMESNTHQALMPGKTPTSDLSNETVLSNRYQNFLNRLNTRYGIEMVANWSLDSLGLQCLIFETDGTRERHRIVTELNQEAEVESAAAVKTFTVQPQ